MILFDRVELPSSINQIMAERETLDPSPEIAEGGENLEDGVEPPQEHRVGYGGEGFPPTGGVAG